MDGMKNSLTSAVRLSRRSLLSGLAFTATSPIVAFGNDAKAGITSRQWQAISSIYSKTLAHPFLKGLTDGSLPKERFDFYLKQDSLYLVAYAEALNLLAARAPRVDWMLFFNDGAKSCVVTEKALHESLLRGASATQMTPVNYAYTNHLLATVSRKSFAEGVAAVLPCYQIYWEVGKELKRRGSKNGDYQRWIDQYSDPKYGAEVGKILKIMDEEAARLNEAQKQVCVDLFVTSSRYEYQFWDMAWRMERWEPQ